MVLFLNIIYLTSVVYASTNLSNLTIFLYSHYSLVLVPKHSLITPPCPDPILFSLYRHISLFLVDISCSSFVQEVEEMDPVPVSVYWFLSYPYQFLVSFSFGSFLFPMNPRKLRIHILKLKLGKEKIARKP